MYEKLLIRRKEFQPNSSLYDETSEVVNIEDVRKAIEIARLEAKIEAYEDAINGGIDFTKGWLQMAKNSLKKKITMYKLDE